ncbi:MAG: methylmalonyl-CoA mutase small subunit [Tannerellaceae bacterium]|jgi:methylmalonyl-CoA mutase|nr:methylmalonyl-CoA mutase small subunit [Tannerellaceae bacterium]
MAEEEQRERLFSEFPPISTAEWMEKITADLKGVPFEKKLVWRTNEGFNVNPFYRREDIEDLKSVTSLPGEFPFVRGTKKGNEWKVRQDIVVADFKAANAKSLDILQKGVTSLGFLIEGDGVTKENIACLLDGIYPDCVELNFTTCNSKVAGLLQILTDYFKDKSVNLSKCYGSVNYNSFKGPLVQGTTADDWVKETAKVLIASKALPNYRVLSVNAHLFNDAGSYITQELGYALAWGNELIAHLSDEGLQPGDVADKIRFNYGISSNYFMEIAKFRAARWLWAEIVDAYKPESRYSSKAHIHAQTSAWNMTLYDAHVNLLRSQTEAMSAAIAGVDSITVVPFDYIYKTPDDFSERIARNQQLLLREECHFDKVVDPAAGSYYIEVLTHSIAEQAWKLFLDIEEKGGFYATLKIGEIQTAVNASASARRKAVATRRETLLGTNQFPNFTETVISKIEQGREKDYPHSNDNCQCPEGESLSALNFLRGSSEFETLRLTTERSGRIPKVFMLTIGNLAMRLARSQFSGNFFACAGYKVIDNLGFATVEEGIEAAVKAEADIVVICSSDDEYAELAPAAFKALNSRAAFVVAGAPACSEDLKAQGITDFVNIKSNVLETLKEFNKRLNL